MKRELSTAVLYSWWEHVHASPGRSIFGATQHAFGQLRQMLSRLEDEAEQEEEALRLRIDEETEELKATMTFSRASVVASVEQEVRLSGV